MFSESSKTKLIIIESVVLVFLVAGIFLIANPPDDESSFITWLCVIFFGAVGIIAPIRFSKEDAATACPRCKKPGGLVVTNQQLISSEPIVKTEDYYRGQRVTPYQVTGHRDHYIETLICKHCGYSEKVRTWYDKWDVDVD